MGDVGMYGIPGPGKSQSVRNGHRPPASWARAPEPIAVIVRIVWELDGEMWLPGKATRWTSTLAYVEFDDTRKLTTGVWVEAGDVRRR